MKLKRYTEIQIISILKKHEAGTLVKNLAHRHGVTENTVYHWKAKFGGMKISGAKRLLGKAELGKACSRSLSRGNW